MQLGDHNLVHMNIIVITEIQESFFSELSVIVGNDRVRDTEPKNDIMDEIYGLLGANFGQGLRFDPFSKFVNCDEQVS
jgi:hypothetical protein